tara:strand:- start:3629 stop:4474 length:846 start_codon:yes stop_codon:yes gene_type:complete
MREKIYSISMNLRVFIKFIGFTLSFYKKSKPGIYFLMYHSVGEQINLEIDIDSILFKEQIGYLQSRGEIISIDTASKMIEEKIFLTKQYFVITFDDGYKNFYENALPILEKNNAPAIIYINTSFIEHPEMIPIDSRTGFTKKMQPMTWEVINKIKDNSLITIGCHGHLHEELPTISSINIKKDINKSLSIFQARLGIQPDHFCYPRGMSNNRVENLIASCFKSSVITTFHGNPLEFIKNNYAIERIPVLKSDGLLWFKLRVSSKLYLDILFFNFISRKFLR